jgi:hypothetical protein
VEEPTAPQGNPTGGQTLTPHPLGTLSEVRILLNSGQADTLVSRLVFCQPRAVQHLPIVLRRTVDTESGSEWNSARNSV